MIAAAEAAFDPDVEATVLRVYGIDPHTVTLRRLWVLLTRLPAGEWKKDRTAAAWSETDYLLAQVVDAVNQVSWIQAQIASGKKKVPMPKPIPRPGQKEEKKQSWKSFTDGFAGMEGVIVNE